MELDGVTTMATLIIVGMKLLNPMKKLKRVVLLKMRPVLVSFKMSMNYVQHHQLILCWSSLLVFVTWISGFCVDQRSSLVTWLQDDRPSHEAVKLRHFMVLLDNFRLNFLMKRPFIKAWVLLCFSFGSCAGCIQKLWWRSPISWESIWTTGWKTRQAEAGGGPEK